MYEIIIFFKKNHLIYCEMGGQSC